MQNGGCCPVPLPPQRRAVGRRRQSPRRTPDDEAASVFCKLFDHVQDIPNSWDSTSLG